MSHGSPMSNLKNNCNSETGQNYNNWRFRTKHGTKTTHVSVTMKAKHLLLLTFPRPNPLSTTLLNRDQSKCIVDLSDNSQLSLKARNSCIDSQWYKKDLLACNLRLDLADLLIQPVSLGNQKSIHIWRQIRIPHTTWGVYTSTRRSQHKYSLLPRKNNKTRDRWISLKLFLEVLIKRKSDSWDVRTF